MKGLQVPQLRPCAQQAAVAAATAPQEQQLLLQLLDCFVQWTTVVWWWPKLEQAVPAVRAVALRASATAWLCSQPVININAVLTEDDDYRGLVNFTSPLDTLEL